MRVSASTLFLPLLFDYEDIGRGFSIIFKLFPFTVDTARLILVLLLPERAPVSHYYGNVRSHTTYARVLPRRWVSGAS